MCCSHVKVYRCWVVYGYSWLASAVPCLLWLGTVGIMIGNLVLLGTQAVGNVSLVAPSDLRPVVTSFWALSIALNVITTGK